LRWFIGGAAAGTVLVAIGLDYKAVFLTLLVPIAVGVLAASINSRASR
jgi:AAHS family 4-hydroxybenzoate transporter-like MFS transporter